MSEKMLSFLDFLLDRKPRESILKRWFIKHWIHLLSEFLSTLILLLLGCMTTVPVPKTDSPVYAALGFGMVVMFNVQIFGHISGAYMNPAVTLSAVMSGKISPILGIGHIVAQCSGAVVGYAVLDLVIAVDLRHHAVCITTPGDEQHYLQSLGIETVITACLMLVMCSLWDPVNIEFRETVPIKVGLTVLGLSLMGGPFTGASMNPARSLGPALWTGIWTQHWIYWVGPILGSVFGTLVYNLIFLNRFNSNY